MKGMITKVAIAGSKILEVLHWVLIAAFIIVVIFCMVTPAGVSSFIAAEGDTLEFANLAVSGFAVSAVSGDGVFDVNAFKMFCIGCIPITALMAMIFRNVYLVLKKSQGGTPFIKDNVRMIKEIGIFSIAIPVVSLIMSIITRLVCGVDAVEVSVDFYGLMIGLVMLCLTQFFAHGVKLEQDVDGLV